MLGANRVFTKEGGTVVLESWNGNTLLKGLVAQCIIKMDKQGRVLYPAGLKQNKEVHHELHSIHS